MVILPSLAVVALIAGCGRGFIKKRPGICYIVAALLALISVWGIWSGALGSLPLWCTRYVTPMLTRGALSASLFLFVMFAGAVPSGSAFMKRVMPIRGELSILASILALGHGAALLKGQLGHILSEASPEGETVIALAVSLALLLIMLPLFVTSFKRVRRKMQPSRWKRLQRWAYGFYALLFLHILLFNLSKARNGSAGARINVAIYGALFLSYAVLRVRKELVKRNAPARALPGILGGCAMLALLLAAFLPAGPKPAFAELEAVSALREEVDALSAELAALQQETDTLRADMDRLLADGAGANVPAEEAVEDAAPVGECASPRYADGKYTGAGIGYNGRLTVSLVIEDGVILSVNLTGTVDDEDYVQDASAGIFSAVIDTQSTAVDAVSGATSTSQGLIEAINDALSKAAAGD